MVKRLLTVLAAVGLLTVAGCAAGQEGAEAEELLRQANEAQAEVGSMTFSMNVVGSAAGQSFTMQMNGGAYLKGEKQGDMVVRAAMTAPNSPATNFQLVSRNGAMYVQANGSWQKIPAGVAEAQTEQLEQQLVGFDVTKYVTDVAVEEGTTFLGEPVTKIDGTIDTKGLISGLFGQLGAAGGVPGGLGATPSQQALDALGPVRAVLYISDVTHLVKAVRLSFEVEAEGQTGTFEVNYALRSVNEPVEIPKPAVA
jgi:outer membrane lipoprotein-sorting protein